MRNLITILTGTKCGTIGASQYRKAIAGVMLLGMRVASSMRFSYARPFSWGRSVARYTVCYVPVHGHAVHAVAVRSRHALQQQALGLLGARLGWHPASFGFGRRGRED